jgi:CDGSH iron-sulfur domain-containing protein 3
MEEDKTRKTGTVVEVITSGPLKITGNFNLKDLKRGIDESPGEVRLCRCGKSGSMPYCDESHKK